MLYTGPVYTIEECYYIRKATDKQGNVIDGVYYVGSTWKLSKRYTKKQREEWELHAFTRKSRYRDTYTYEQALIDYCKAMAIPLSNKVRAFPWRPTQDVLPDDVKEYIQQLSRALGIPESDRHYPPGDFDNL